MFTPLETIISPWTCEFPEGWGSTLLKVQEVTVSHQEFFCICSSDARTLWERNGLSWQTTIKSHRKMEPVSGSIPHAHTYVGHYF